MILDIQKLCDEKGVSLYKCAQEVARAGVYKNAHTAYNVLQVYKKRRNRTFDCRLLEFLTKYFEKDVLTN